MFLAASGIQRDGDVVVFAMFIPLMIIVFTLHPEFIADGQESDVSSEDNSDEDEDGSDSEEGGDSDEM